jgi:hypothetical protein
VLRADAKFPDNRQRGILLRRRRFLWRPSLALELFGKEWQLPLLMSVLRRWPDPRQLRRADRRLIRRVLQDHAVRNEEKQNEVIDRIRSAQLLTRDDALITPAAMAVELLAHQIQLVQKTIGEFEVIIAEAMK